MRPGIWPSLCLPPHSQHRTPCRPPSRPPPAFRAVSLEEVFPAVDTAAPVGTAAFPRRRSYWGSAVGSETESAVGRPVLVVVCNSFPTPAAARIRVDLEPSLAVRPRVDT